MLTRDEGKWDSEHIFRCQATAAQHNESISILEWNESTRFKILYFCSKTVITTVSQTSRSSISLSLDIYNVCVDAKLNNPGDTHSWENELTCQEIATVSLYFPLSAVSNLIINPSLSARVKWTLPQFLRRLNYSWSRLSDSSFINKYPQTQLFLQLFWQRACHQSSLNTPFSPYNSRHYSC